MKRAALILFHIIACTRCEGCEARVWPWQTTRVIVEPSGATLFYHVPCAEEKAGRDAFNAMPELTRKRAINLAASMLRQRAEHRRRSTPTPTNGPHHE